MSQVTNYQCPSCTGPLHYVGSSGKLECDYCGSSFDVAEIEALYAPKDEAAAQETAQQPAGEETAEEIDFEADGVKETEWDTSNFNADWGAEAEEMKAYICPSCGAELICDVSTAATSCPYCGNPTVVPGQFAGALKPDFVIPFKLNKDDAINALKEHYKGKPLLPKAFTKENHIDEIKGVYVPFWLFDGEAEGGARYETTRTRVYRLGDEEITETRHYDVYRAGRVRFEKIPVDASSKMPDEHMDSIEPYDYSELVPFSTAYLPGFLADKYDVSVDDSRKRADLRCENSLHAALRDTVQGYDSCVRVSDSSRLRRGKVHYALMPVWMLNTKWHGKDYLFAMNGQTGKMVGDLPMSWGKFWGMFAAISVPLGVIGSLISLLMH